MEFRRGLSGSASPETARGSGVFAGPAGAAAYAGLVHATREDMISEDERIVVLNTGNGLKDVAGDMQAVERAGTQPYTVAPDVEELKRIVAGW